MDVSREWKGGTPLADAWVKFAPARLRAEYYDYEPGDVHGHPPDKVDFDPSDRAALLNFSSKIMPQLFEQMGMVEPPVAAIMREAVLGRIIKGTLVAVGIPFKPTPSLQPAIIPDTMLKASFIKWNKSAIDGGGFAFRDVKLFRPSKVADGPKVEASYVASPPSNRRSAKAARDEAIRQAFRRVKSAFPETHSKTAVARAIYEDLKSNPLFPGARGLSYDKVCRVLDGTPGF